MSEPILGPCWPTSVRGTAPPAATTGTVTVTGVPIHGHRPVRPVLVITVFCLGLFMTLLDITIVNIAIPDLVTDLNATLETVLWVGSAYSLTYTVLLITAGRLGDIHGPRRLFLIGLTVFTAASLASGLSQTPGQLIAFRALQGVGAALLAPQGLPIITSILPAAKRGPAFAATGIMSGLGVLLGPTLGGFIVTNYRLAVDLLPQHPDRHRRHRAGVRLHAGRPAGCPAPAGYPRRRAADRRAVRRGLRADRGRAVRLGHHHRVRHDPAGDRGRRRAAGAVPLAAGPHPGPEPLLPFAVFSDRTFTVMTLVLLAMGFAMVGVFLPMTIYYQSVLGLTAVAAGLVIGTQSLAMMITSGVVGGLSGSGKINMKWVLIVGLLLFAAGMVYVVAWPRPTPGSGRSCPGWSPPASASAACGRRCSGWPPGTCRRPGRASAPACWTPCRSSARCWRPRCSVRCWPTG